MELSVSDIEIQPSEQQFNVFGEKLLECSCQPMTGFYRDGLCRTQAHDVGSHTVCAQVTSEFLDYSLQQGNDLITPRPEHGFDGLKPGDRWCLCAARWLEAFSVGKAPMVVLEATNRVALDIVSLADLKKNALDLV